MNIASKATAIIGHLKLFQSISLFSPKCIHHVSELNTTYPHSQSRRYFSTNQSDKEFLSKRKVSAKHNEGAGPTPGRLRAKPPQSPRQELMGVRHMCRARGAAMARQYFPVFLPCVWAGMLLAPPELSPAPGAVGRMYVNYTGNDQHMVFQRITTHKPKHESVVAQKDGWLDMEIPEISPSLPPPAAYAEELLKQEKYP